MTKQIFRRSTQLEVMDQQSGWIISNADVRDKNLIVSIGILNQELMKHVLCFEDLK